MEEIYRLRYGDEACQGFHTLSGMQPSQHINIFTNLGVPDPIVQRFLWYKHDWLNHRSLVIELNLPLLFSPQRLMGGTESSNPLIVMETLLPLGKFQGFEELCASN